MSASTIANSAGLFDVFTALHYVFLVSQAGVEKLKIKGRGQVIFNPLIPRLPVVAAVKVCIKQAPMCHLLC